MRFSGFRFGLLAAATALPSWALISTSTSCGAPSSAVYGQQITITSTVASADGSVPTGSVSFFAGGNSLGAADLNSFGTAQLSASFIPGTYGINCTYSGDATHASSVSAVVLLTVTQATPTITLTPSVNPAPVGQLVDIDIVVAAFAGSPLGSVTLMDGNIVLGVFLLQQQQDSSFAQYRSSKFSGGTHLITASYDGDMFFTPATTKQPLLLVIVRRTTTTVIRGVSPSTAKSGQPIAIQVQVSSDLGIPTGSVTLTENAKTLATVTLTAAVATITLTNLALGTHPIVANYSGDAVFDVSSSAPFNVQVNGAATTTQLAATPNPLQVGHTVPLTAKVTSPGCIPSESVTFQYAHGAIGTANLDATGQATLATSFVAPGNQTITASYTASTQFAASNSAALTLTVIPRQLTITSASSFKTIVSPDSLATVFGDNLAAGPVIAGLLPWPPMLVSVSLVFRANTGTERLAALKFVSPGQINAVVPPDMPLGQATVIVRSATADVESGTATIAAIAPGLFPPNGTPTSSPAA